MPNSFARFRWSTIVGTCGLAWSCAWGVAELGDESSPSVLPDADNTEVVGGRVVAVSVASVAVPGSDWGRRYGAGASGGDGGGSGGAGSDSVLGGSGGGGGGGVYVQGGEGKGKGKGVGRYGRGVLSLLSPASSLLFSSELAENQRVWYAADDGFTTRVADRSFERARASPPMTIQDGWVDGPAEGVTWYRHAGQKPRAGRVEVRSAIESQLRGSAPLGGCAADGPAGDGEPSRPQAHTTLLTV